MSIEAESANVAVDKSIELTETAAKLLGIGVKNLAALVLALATDSDKLTGKNNLQSLVKEGKEPVVFPLNSRDLHAFSRQAKITGNSFSFTTIKSKNSDTVQVIASSDDIAKINKALSNIGYGAQSLKAEEAEKNAKPRAPLSKVSNERGNGLDLQAATNKVELPHPDLIPTGAKQVIYNIAQDGEKGLEALGADTLAVVAAALLGDNLNWIEKAQLKKSIAEIDTHNRQPATFHISKYDLEVFRKQLRKKDIDFIAIPRFSDNAVQIVAEVKDMPVIRKVMDGLGYKEPLPIAPKREYLDGRQQDKPSVVDTVEAIKKAQRAKREGQTKQRTKEAPVHDI